MAHMASTDKLLRVILCQKKVSKEAASEHTDEFVAFNSANLLTLLFNCLYQPSLSRR